MCVFIFTEAYICGGIDGMDIIDDIWKLNLQTFEWTKLPTILQLPVYFHSADITPVSTCLYYAKLDIDAIVAVDSLSLITYI